MKYYIIPNFKTIEYFFLLISLKIKTSVFVFGMMIYGKIKGTMKDRPRQDSNQKRHHKWSFIMVIDNNDSRTFRPVAIMLGGKAEINASGSFRISRHY